MREALNRLLLSSGFGVEVFDSAQALLNNLPQESNICALVDVDLPDSGGVELCARLAALTPPIPAILMSTLDETTTRGLVRRYEPVACLLKPFDRRALVRAIRRATRPSEP